MSGRIYPISVTKKEVWRVTYLKRWTWQWVSTFWETKEDAINFIKTMHECNKVTLHDNVCTCLLYLSKEVVEVESKFNYHDIWSRDDIIKVTRDVVYGEQKDE
jgi:hypothetical protein